MKKEFVYIFQKWLQSELHFVEPEKKIHWMHFVLAVEQQ